MWVRPVCRQRSQGDSHHFVSLMSKPQIVQVFCFNPSIFINVRFSGDHWEDQRARLSDRDAGGKIDSS